jgi:hypothetical protein
VPKPPRYRLSPNVFSSHIKHADISHLRQLLNASVVNFFCVNQNARGHGLESEQLMEASSSAHIYSLLLAVIQHVRPEDNVKCSGKSPREWFHANEYTNAIHLQHRTGMDKCVLV